MANFNLGRLSNRVVSRNNFSVTPGDRTDVFRFSIANRRQIGLHLHRMNGDADLRLFRDTNRNGVFDRADRQVAVSRLSGARNDTIDFTANRGTYFARVERFRGPRRLRYDLDLAATYDVGRLGNAPIARNRFSVNPSDPTDVFEFDINSARTINLGVNRISPGDNVDLQLYRDNGNGVFDAGDRVIARSSRSGNRDELINFRATRGTYFAQVAQARRASGGGSAFYDLDMSATTGRASNVIGAEVQLGNLSRDLTRFGSVTSRDTNDTYAFSLGFFEGVNIRLGGLSRDADIRLIRDRNNNGVVDPGEVIGSSTRAGTAVDSINNINRSGNYLLQVYQFSGNTAYRVTFDRFTTPFS
ncbi:MAG: pre-peptidase C-terminal domain-containing protein [Cyanobacteria bacterium J06638_22]